MPRIKAKSVYGTVHACIVRKIIINNVIYINIIIENVWLTVKIMHMHPVCYYNFVEEINDLM